MTWHTELLTGVVSLLGHFIALQYDDKMTVNWYQHFVDSRIGMIDMRFYSDLFHGISDSI